MYNPRRAPHQLSNSSSLSSSLSSLSSLAESDFAAAMASRSALSHSGSVSGVGGMGVGAGVGRANSIGLDESLSSLPGSNSPRMRPLTTSNTYSSKRDTSSRGRGGGGGGGSDLKRMWQLALRYCHRSDPERSGRVSLLTFISALENANTNNVSPLFSLHVYVYFCVSLFLFLC